LHVAKRFLSDLKARRQHVKLFESWRKENTNKYLQTNLDSNYRQSQDVLRNKSIPEKLNRLSKCEEKMLAKINNSLFSNQKRTIYVNDEVQFIKNNVSHEKHNLISEEIQLKIKNEVNVNISIF